MWQYFSKKYFFKRFIPLFFSIACTTITGTAQDTAMHVKSWSGLGIELNAIAGKVVKHEAKFTLPIPAITTGLNINFLLHSYGKKAWEQRRKYPIIGLAVCYINYGIDSIYGRCFGLYPNIVLPLVSGENIQWTCSIGDGIGYVTKRYSRTAPVDTINVAIGSHINDLAMVNTDVRYHANNHWDMQLGANITHISDASFHKPNLGINMVGVHAGITYFPVTSRPPHIVRTLKPITNRWLVEVKMGMAMVSNYTANGPVYPIYITTGYVSRRWLSKNKAFAGLDYSYHTDTYAFLKNNGLEVGREAQNSYKSAIVFGNEFLLGRIGIVMQVGGYIKQNYLKKDPVYEKVGGNYYIVQKENGPIKEFFVSVFLKTDLTVAEFGEAGIGVGF